MKIISKKKFQDLNNIHAKKMFRDKRFQKNAINLLVLADKKFRWVHQSNWMGEPMLNTPQDIIATQEIIFNTKPDYIIETGIAWGGSILFLASMLKIAGGKKVIGIDTYLPNSVKKAISKHINLKKYIHLINGDSTSPDVVKEVKKILNDSKKVLIILDSNHTHQHVLDELKIYSEFVKKNNYIICGDTIVEFIPKQKHRPREWGPGNNPFTALKEFLRKNKRFKIDEKINNKLLLTCHPKGYLIAKT
jgi:cephalosporin hydroxylase